MAEMITAITALKGHKAAGLEDILVEQVKHFGQGALTWLMNMFNHCIASNKIPKAWRIAKISVLLKPGKDPSIPRNYKPISLLCHIFKPFERLILARVAPFVDDGLISEQAGFRPGSSCTDQLLNLTQFIEDSFEKGEITRAAFVVLSAACDTANHRILIKKLYDCTLDPKLN